jgi:hypothetical protein
VLSDADGPKTYGSATLIPGERDTQRSENKYCMLLMIAHNDVHCMAQKIPSDPVSTMAVLRIKKWSPSIALAVCWQKNGNFLY